MAFLRAFGAEAGNLDYFTNATGLSIDTTPVRTGIRSLLCNMGTGQAIGSGAWWDLTAGEEDDRLFLGGALHGASNVAAPGVVFCGSGVVHLIIIWDQSDRRIKVYRGTTATLLAQSDPEIWDFDTFDYWEVETLVADAAGVVNIRKNANAAPVLAFSGDTRNGGADALIDRVNLIRGSGFGGAAAHNWDDLYLCNEAGAAPHNTYLGDVQIYPSNPNAPGFYTQLVPTGSATNWQNVDDGPTPNDADFNGDTVVADIDTYGFEDLPIAGGSVLGVLVHTRAFKSDAGAKSGSRVYRRAGVDDFGADLTLGTSPANFAELLPTDPIAAGAWTVANVNAAEFGFRVRA